MGAFVFFSSFGLSDRATYTSSSHNKRITALFSWSAPCNLNFKLEICVFLSSCAQLLQSLNQMTCSRIAIAALQNKLVGRRSAEVRCQMPSSRVFSVALNFVLDALIFWMSKTTLAQMNASFRKQIHFWLISVFQNMEPVCNSSKPLLKALKFWNENVWFEDSCFRNRQH